MSQAAPSFRAFLAPRHWPTWLGICVLWLSAHLPQSLRMGMGRLIGRLSHALAKDRRYITAVNIRLCFPELDALQQAQLVKDSFLANGIGLIETVTGWVKPAEHFRNKVSLLNPEQLEAARAQGRGVLILGAHYSTLDFSANLFSLFCPFAVTYRPHRNPLFDAFILRGRLRHCEAVIDRRDVRGAFRHLKDGKVLWYAPDQDYGPKHAVFVPFFGQQAATLTASTRFARANGSPVFVARHHRIEGSDRYELALTLVPDFPSGDETADAARINQLLEQAIRHYPAQYLWMHKRFKTQPGGKPESPYILIKTPRRKGNEESLKQLLQGAEPLPHGSSLLELQRLQNGQYLALYPGRLPSQGRSRHPAGRLDQAHKQRRHQGQPGITVDYFLVLKDRTAMVFFKPDDLSLSPLFGSPDHAQ